MSEVLGHQVEGQSGLSPSCCPEEAGMTLKCPFRQEKRTLLLTCEELGRQAGMGGGIGTHPSPVHMEAQIWVVRPDGGTMVVVRKAAANGDSR